MTTEQPAKLPELGETVVAGGVETNYLRAGSGPTVLLLHGSGPGVTAYANWRFTIPALSKRFRVVAPDIVGFGYTQRPMGFSYNKIGWVAHLIDFLDAIGADEVDVVGNSFGGALALALAVHHPARIRRLVLMGSVGLHFELTPGLDGVWGYEPSLEGMRRLLQLFVYDRGLITDDLVASRYRASARVEAAAAYARLFPAPRQRHVDALALSDIEIRSLTCNALVVHGREDRVIPPAVGLCLHELLARSELHMFGQCGHWTQIEQRDRFNQVLVGFLGSRR